MEWDLSRWIKMVQNDYDLDKFFSYVFHSQKYRTKLERSIENGLWEYATVLTWKNVILFIYEKLFQRRVLGLDLPSHIINTFQDKNITCTSCFDFHHIKDEKIGENLYQCWNDLDSNYKSSFTNLLDERNRLSHVNRYEEDFNEQWFKTYFEKSLKLLDYLQSLNNVQLSHKIYGFIESSKTVQCFSEEDINYLLSQDSYEDSKIINYILDFIDISNYPDTLKDKLKQEAIKSFLDSPSFASALENGEGLIKLISFCEEQEIREILIGIFERQGTPNQIVQAGKMEYVIETLFDETTNLEGLREDWKKFIDRIIEMDEQRYGFLKEKFLETYGDFSEVV